jgi:mRNA interferase MazF
MPRKNKRAHERRLGQKSLNKLIRSVDIKPRRMEIWFAYLREETGSAVQCGARPVLIVGNNLGNTHSEVVTAIPMTSREKRLDLPTHVRIRCDENPGLDRDSTLLVEQIMPIDKQRLRHRCGVVTNPQTIHMIEQAMSLQLGISS